MAYLLKRDKQLNNIQLILKTTMKIRITLPKLLVMSGLLAIMSVSCKKLDDPTAVSSNKVEEMIISPAFKFETTQAVGIQIRTLDNKGVPVPNIRVDIYTDLPDNGGALIMSGMSDANGLFSSDYKIGAGTDSLAVGTRAIGFCNMQKVKVSGGALKLTLGGKKEPSVFKSGNEAFFKTTNANFYPLGTYASNGVPNYLVTPNDVVDASMLQDINATLPEYIAAPTSHPQYFVASNESNLVLNDACNVWVTFVHEGAGYRNVLGYYTYNSNNPPTSASQIDSIHVVFPNVSFGGSGGGLTSGNKVYIGQHAPGTEIGWVLVADGFRNGAITNGNWIFYSDKNLNPEVAESKKQHTLLLNDIGRGKFLLSFEDIKREGSSSDNDFNDAIFYVTADPISSVQTTDIPLPNYTSPDGDGDGISDTFDDYPADPSAAFDNYYPSKNNSSSLAFEDYWPAVGDYDFNDMVVDYNFNQITNGQNKVVQIVLKTSLKALGASYRNGFGIQLPVASNLVASVTGTNIQESFVVRNSNGTEAGQSKATIIVFDNGFNLLPHPGGSSTGVNTTPGATYVDPQELTITIKLTQPVTLSSMGLPPYNPFMIVNGKRGREVHLIDNPPTDLADMAYLGSVDDDSDPATGRYYVTQTNLPYAIDVSGHFDYPVEKKAVSTAHLKFVQWGESSGTQYYDWFNPNSGYRYTQNIYSH
jgi:LruC domain-containing protein